MLQFTVLVSIVLQVSTEVTPPNRPAESQLRIVNKLSQVTLPPKVLGDGWTHVDGLVIDDFKSKVNRPKPIQEMVDQLRVQMEPLGIVGVADYSLAKTNVPLDTVTVRVFIFADPKKCQSWWRTKY
jgi:hypothetical protein